MVRECPAAYRRVRETEAEHSSVHSTPTRQPGRTRAAPRPCLCPAPRPARPTATPRGRPGRARHVRAGSSRHLALPADRLHGEGAARPKSAGENRMKNWNGLERPARRILLGACSAAFAATLTVSLPLPARAAHVAPPPVPAGLGVQPGNHAFLEGHAVGTQNYSCLPCPNATTPAAA